MTETKMRAIHTASMPVEHIDSHILVIRGHRVMLDADLADLYGVPTKRLNEQVKPSGSFPRRFHVPVNRRRG